MKSKEVIVLKWRLRSTILLCIIICIINTTAVAEKEIAFLDIPWLANDETTINSLYDKGYIRDNRNVIPFSHEECSFLTTDENNNTIITTINQNKYCVSVNLSDLVKGKIGGYGLSNISLSFAYDGEYKLIYAKLKFINAEYVDIKEKLQKVYGIGEEYEVDGDPAVIWKGDNNSCVVLFEYYDGKAFDLCYGRLDASEIIEKCSEIDSNDVSGL